MIKPCTHNTNCCTKFQSMFKAQFILISYIKIFFQITPFAFIFHKVTLKLFMLHMICRNVVVLNRRWGLSVSSIRKHILSCRPNLSTHILLLILFWLNVLCIIDCHMINLLTLDYKVGTAKL